MEEGRVGRGRRGEGGVGREEDRRGEGREDRERGGLEEGRGME